MAEDKTVITIKPEEDLYQWIRKSADKDDRSMNVFILRILRKLYEAELVNE